MTTTQNLISLTLSDAQLQAVDQALSDLEAQLTGLVAMTSAQRRKLARMGDKSEAFCRQTLSMLSQNPQVVPATLNVADAVSDLQALDRLRPRLQRITQLAERASDTEIALGSDVMRCALDALTSRNADIVAPCSARASGARRPAAVQTQPVRISASATTCTCNAPSCGCWRCVSIWPSASTNNQRRSCCTPYALSMTLGSDRPCADLSG